MAKKRPRLFIVIDQGMVWEAYGDIEIKLLIKNVDKQWMRSFEVAIDPSKIDEEEELIDSLEELNIPLPGLEKEKKKRVAIKKPEQKFTRTDQSKIKKRK